MALFREAAMAHLRGFPINSCEPLYETTFGILYSYRATFLNFVIALFLSQGPGSI